VPYYSIDHFQNLALHELEILGIPSRGAANDIVNSTIVILSAHAAF
jgi:hypothetical protein